MGARNRYTFSQFQDNFGNKCTSARLHVLSQVTLYFFCLTFHKVAQHLDKIVHVFAILDINLYILLLPIFVSAHCHSVCFSVQCHFIGGPVHCRCVGNCVECSSVVSKVLCHSIGGSVQCNSVSSSV